MMNEPQLDSPVPSYKLYSVGQIVLAAFLGSPIAGCALLALNYRSLKRSVAALHSLIWGVVSSAVLLAVAFVLPEHFPNAVLPMAYCFGLRQIAISSQGSAISSHLAAGGRKGSWGLTVAIGTVCLLIVLANIIVLVLLLSSLGE